MSKTSLDFGFFCDVNQNNIAFFTGVNHLSAPLSGPLTSTALRGHGLWLFSGRFRSVLFSEFTCFHVLALKFFLSSGNCCYRASKSWRNTDIGGVKTNLVPHLSSGIVERAKRERAWKSPHARKARRGGEREKFIFNGNSTWASRPSL